MAVMRKVNAAYNKRQNEYAAMIKAKDGDPKVRDRMDSGGYKRPGSQNPRKARNG